MPLYPVSNQPYFPDPLAPNRYGCAGTYCYPVQVGDILYWQGYQTPCNASLVEDDTFSDITLGAEQLTNGTFTGNANGWVTISGALPNDNWTYSANAVHHTAGSDEPLIQTGLSLVVGTVYRVVVVMTRTAGDIYIQFGDGSGATFSDELDSSGTHTFDMLYLEPTPADNKVHIFPSDDFVGSIDSISVKPVTYNLWDGNGKWLFDGAGKACKPFTGTGDLEQTTSNYLTAGEYYQVKFTVSEYAATGTLTPVLSATSGTAVSANGIYTQYITPAADGVLKFTPSSDFIGCVEDVEVFLLRNDYQTSLMTELGDGDTYDISDYLTYTEDKVTLILDLEEAEIPLGCHIIELTDQCDVQFEELVTNGDFGGGQTGWQINNTAPQYDFTGGTMEFIYPSPAGPAQVSTPLMYNAVNPNFVAGANYEVSFDIVSTSNANIGVRVNIDSTLLGTYQSGVGTKTYQLNNYQPSASFNANRAIVVANFTLDGSDISGLGELRIKIDNISVRRIEPFDATYTSECIKYAASHRHSKLITAYCDKNNLGFEFENSGFKLQQRVICRSVNPQFPKRKIIQKTGSGDARVVYSESEKYWELHTEDLSESAIQGLSDQVDCDHFLIGDSPADQIEYLAEAENMSPAWVENGAYDLAPVIITLRVKEGGQKFNRHY